MSTKSNTAEFITKAYKIHGGKYSYDKSYYVDARYTKVEITCSIHGSFWQTPDNHLRGRGCPSCRDYDSTQRQLLTKEDFISKAKEIHGDRYIYDALEYNGYGNQVTIICRIHGAFKQYPGNHLKGRNCLQCSKMVVLPQSQIKPFDVFVDQAQVIHCKKYDYIEDSYAGAKKSLVIICPNHGQFKQTPDAHLAGKGCPKCSHRVSSGHLEMSNFIESLGLPVLINTRSAIHPFELDVFVPMVNLAVEFNGTYWHSFNSLETSEERNRHLQKYRLCQERNITLLQFFEDEWQEHPGICRSIIKAKCGRINRKISARDAHFERITRVEAGEFLTKNHLQGNTPLISDAFGLIHDDVLVSVMTFSKHIGQDIALTRFASQTDTIVVGGMSKLLKHAIPLLAGKRIITFSNNAYSIGNVYAKLGFQFDKNVKPSYSWVKGIKRYNKRQFRHSKMADKLKGYDASLSEAENMFAHGYRRMWDAGYMKWVMPIQQ